MALILAAIAAPAKAHAAPASSLPPTWVTYPLSYSGQPNDLRLGPDGRWWVPEHGGGAIDRLTTSGVDSPIAWTSTFNGPRLTPGADGNMWMTDSPNNFFTGQIDKISPTGTLLATYPDVTTGNTIPLDIVNGPDGNVWYTTNLAGDIVRVTPGGAETRFSWPGSTTLSQSLSNVTVGPDGNLWTSDQSQTIDRITPGGVFSILPPLATLDHSDSVPWRITAGPDGNVYYSDLGSDEIVRITWTGDVTQFDMPPGIHPTGIVTGSDGNLWFTDGFYTNNVGRMTPSGQVGFFDVSSAGNLPFPNDIAAGPDGRIWLTLCCSSGGNSAVAAFQPFAPATSPPDIRNLSIPYSVPSGGGQVVVTGYDMSSATQVFFGSTPATSFHAVGPSQLAVTIPPHVIGEADVTVVTPDGTTTTSSASQFFYEEPRCAVAITKSTLLTGDIGPCYAGLTVAADNITLDLGGHQVFGFQTPRDGGYTGIDLEQRSGVTVQNGAVTGFDAGVHIAGGSGNTVAHLNIHDNVGPDNVFGSRFGDGIMIEQGSRSNQIVHNVVDHNGVFDGIGVFDPGSDNNTIAFNTVENTVGPANRGPAGEGIIVNGASGGLPTAIHSTVIVHNTVSNSASGGIANVNEIGGTVEYNTVTGSGATNSFGNGIGVQVGFSWNLGPTQMVIEHNQVNGNGVDGIRLGGARGFFRGAAEGNTVAYNTATGNSANPGVDIYEGRRPGFDLHDNDPTCGTNVWSKNTWGIAGFTPACTSTGGTGPAPPAAAPSAAAPNRAAASVDPTTDVPNAQAWETFLERGRH